MITISKWLSEATRVLQQAQDNGQLDEYCSAKREAYYLMAHVLNKTSAYLMAFAEQQLEKESIFQLNKYLQERLEGKPIAYILGVKEFWSLPIKVSPVTLIPRADTECLVEKVLMLYPDTTLEVLDLGTGTGAIVFALAKERLSWQLTGVDVVAKAVELANENKDILKEYIVNSSRIHFKQSYWFENLNPNHQFDIIVSNPPYIIKSDEHLLKGDVRFEPKTALISDAEGLADIYHIVSEAKNYLKRGGKLFLEHGHMQHESVKSAMLLQGYHNIESHQDYNGKVRVTFAEYNGK